MTSLLIEARRETGTRSVMIISERDSRVWMNGGRIVAVRRQDVPGGGELAAILRYPFTS